MISDILNLLRCPVCKAEMERDGEGKTCRCRGARKHCFDFSRSGYLHLGGPHAGDGDGKEAVLARRAFLDAGHYQPLSDTVNRLLEQFAVRRVVDAGCGEGYYTNRMAEVADAVLGIDLSRAGIDYAARRAKQQQTRAGFAVASLFEMPIQSESVDAVVNLFAPCAEEEFLRVLKLDGILLLVGAGERHLMGLKQAIYQTPYANEGRADLPKGMELLEKKKLCYEISVEGREMIAALFSMTPYYWRTSEHDRAKLDLLERLTTEVDFDIFVFRKEREG
ncbi:MAG: methyltransferase domain-containing protein [Clostridia bacterium]|nr:methyltransferase domain-containing protein [Clostridia bacterium]